MKAFYITTAIPYVNGKPHIGHALEYFQADTIRNYQRLLGKDTLLLSGADENALKNVQAAEAERIEIQDFLDKNSKVFRDSYERLGIHLDVFQRGSDQIKHWPGVQELWKRCFENGDIYKKSYTGLYCVGCESFKTEKELVDGKCPDHLKEPEKITEENYFFKLSDYQQKLLDLIEGGGLDLNNEKIKLEIIPENKKNEIVSFIKQGLEDFSISRSVERARGVGVPVPNDPTQVMYVWFDALAIYITGIGFNQNQDEFNKWWPADVHVIGKDINRFHTVYWPAMLLSANLLPPKSVLVHGFIQSGGQKMSKTLGNVIDPFEISEKYGLESFRYFMLSQIPTDSDGDFTEERFKEVYNADLVNGLGNLVSRVAALCEQKGVEVKHKDPRENSLLNDVSFELENFRFNEALNLLWGKIRGLDQYINQERPWQQELSNSNKTLSNIVIGIEGLTSIIEIAQSLKPFLPETSKKILDIFKGPKITAVKDPLFPRIP